MLSRSILLSAVGGICMLGYANNLIAAEINPLILRAKSLNDSLIFLTNAARNKNKLYDFLQLLVGLKNIAQTTDLRTLDPLLARPLNDFYAIAINQLPFVAKELKQPINKLLNFVQNGLTLEKLQRQKEAIANKSASWEDKGFADSTWVSYNQYILILKAYAQAVEKQKNVSAAIDLLKYLEQTINFIGLDNFNAYFAAILSSAVSTLIEFSENNPAQAKKIISEAAIPDIDDVDDLKIQFLKLHGKILILLEPKEIIEFIDLIIREFQSNTNEWLQFPVSMTKLLEQAIKVYPNQQNENIINARKWLEEMKKVVAQMQARIEKGIKERLSTSR